MNKDIKRNERAVLWRDGVERKPNSMFGRAFVVCAVLAASSACAFAYPDDDSEKFKLPHITVEGTAEVSVRPDFASLSLGVVSEKPTAAEAASDIASATASVIANLKSLGVDPKDIRTDSLNLDPVMLEERDPKTNQVIKRTLSGYRARTTLLVSVHDVEKAGPLASRVIEKGANVFNWMSFGVSDYENHVDQLRARAVAEAKRRASLYAQGADAKLGRLLALDPEADRNDGSQADLPTRKGAMSSGPLPIVIPVEPGVQTITARVTATWELVPE